jgi:hypothetical protein
MRRAFSILFVLLFGLGPLSAIAGGEDANLPACCRRNGAHHCAMTARMAARMRQAESGSAATISAPITCPSYPGLSAIFTAPDPALLASTVRMPATKAQAFASAAICIAPTSSPNRDHAGRGPPASSLS